MTQWKIKKASTRLNTPISITELETNLTGLPNKAMGRDRIHNEMLKNLNQNNRTILLKLLNISLNTGYPSSTDISLGYPGDGLTDELDVQCYVPWTSSDNPNVATYDIKVR
ncbi:hypothetical protein DAPPUDRAFT_243954 [Daphnia pulex]|uniref:Uncharacterized protein n=1 Tax=Daphnia pulex TaxID=6669 RepID=E9GJW9_DAPPU|nr:hypothetical protein DAPPUDRAFT_243954 [Daphnia pulex]|eukprot:EFX80190.1 hypothetical protein DAPPUDRAFT_243954 [Daphnia pulex]